MIAECYVLNVQCDQKHTVPVRDQFTGRNVREAWHAAMQAGWRLTPPDAAWCPTCASAIRLAHK
jgi:hypothetical protein